MKYGSSGVATLKRDGTNYAEASDRAEILNDQFASGLTGPTGYKTVCILNSFEHESSAAHKN